MPFSPSQILQTLRYFGHFSYPLSKEELFAYASAKGSIKELEPILEQLLISRTITEHRGYYSIADAAKDYQMRQEGALRCHKMQARIEKSCRRLRFFPFIEFVGLSGSLAKGFAGPRADIDLFIVTRKNRLWICRTLLHIFKKFSFLKHSQHWYCMNYFIDESALRIEEQNYFTAIELSSLKPLLNNNNLHERLMKANKDWLNSQLPNFPPQGTVSTNSVSFRNRLSTLVAECCASDRLNAALMQLTDRRWRKKWEKRNFAQEDYDLAFKTRINVSKNHRHNYQKKLLSNLNPEAISGKGS
jgi:hypothetical protein